MKYVLSLLLCSLVFFSCSSDSTDDSQIPASETSLSSSKLITAFKITDNNMIVTATTQNDSIFHAFTTATDLSRITPIIEISDKATISPASGVATDFTSPVVYTVTAEDNSVKRYTVVLTSPDNETALYTIRFTNSAGSQSFSRSQDSATGIETITVTVPYGTDVTALTSAISIPATASVRPASGATLDYSTPQSHVITAEDGTQKEYLIRVVERELQAIDIQGFHAFSFRDVPLGGDITFEVTALHENLEDISVQLISDQDEFDLEVKSVNMDDMTITATLPANYNNNSYRLKVSIAPNNEVVSNSFILVKGTTNFVEVEDYYGDGDYHVQTAALLPGSLLNLQIYFKNYTSDGYSFFIKINGTEYELEVIYYLLSGYLHGVRVQMPAISNPMQMNGNTLELIIRNEDGDQLYALTNSEGNAIEGVVASAPEVTGIVNSTVSKDGTLTIMGNHLFTTFAGDLGTAVQLRSMLRLEGSGVSYGFLSSALDANGNMSFDLGTSSILQSGTYTVYFQGNISQYSEINTNQTVTITLPASEHPTLQVTEAKLYRDTSSGLQRQIKLNFNEDISGYTITKIVTGRAYQVEVFNYFENTNSILTDALTNTNYLDAFKYRDGYALVMDNGQEYKVYFTLTPTSL